MFLLFGIRNKIAIINVQQIRSHTCTSVYLFANPWSETLAVKCTRSESLHAPSNISKRAAAEPAASLLESVGLVAIERPGDDADEKANLDERPTPA